MATSVLLDINNVVKYRSSMFYYLNQGGDSIGWSPFTAAKRFYTCLLRDTGGGTMIDLSHLTEEEQGVIMTVLRRDAELKKAEDERISKLEKIFNSGATLDTKWKYLTGEWFYEAKSRRHTDKIHGSEIILASIKQKKAPSEGSLSPERYKTSIRQGSDIVAPLKPRRCLETLQPQAISDAKTTESNKSMNPTVRSPRMPRQNPFNRASLIDYEPPERNNGMSSSRAQESSDTEPISPLKKHQGEEASQTSGGSVTSDTSAAGFRPVPKKRTFLSRNMSGTSERSGQGLDAQVGSAAVVPAPRLSLQQWTSVSSSQSYPLQGETLQKSAASHQVSQTAPPFKSHEEHSQQPLSKVSQVSSNSSVAREETPSSLSRDSLHNIRRAMNTWSDVSTDRSIPQKSDMQYDETHREHAALNTVILYTGSIQDSDREDSVGTAMRQEELSLPQSIVDPVPPISYDLNFIDKSEEQTKKSNQKHVFKLSTPTAGPTGEEDSIAKVLDWFSRSTDSIDWPSTRDGPEASKSSEKHVETSKFRGEDSLGRNAGDVRSDHLQKQTDEAKELSTTDSVGNKELTKIQEMRKDERQPAQISHLKSFWERSKIGPKILSTKSMMVGEKGLKPDQLSAGKDENVDRPHGVSDMPSDVYNIQVGPYGVDREQLVDGPQKDTGDSVHLNNNQEVNSLVMNSSSHGNSDNTNLAANPQADKRGSDTERLSLTGLSPRRRTAIESRLSPESESVSLFKSNPQLENELSKTAPVCQNSPYMDYRQGQNDAPINPETQTHRGPNKDVNWWESEDKTKQVSMSPKQQEDMSNRDRINSPQLNRQGVTHQESSAERIKQLKSFWEQERKPMFYNGKPKPLGEHKINRGPSQAKLNKRFTKSDFDLRSIGDYSGNDEEGAERNQDFMVVPLNQKIEKSSPSLSTSRTQFNTLREFWDETTSDSKGSFSSDKSKSPKRKDQLSAQLPPEEFKCGEPAMMKSSPPNHLKSPHDRQSGSRAANDSKDNPTDMISESRKSPQDFNREEKLMKPQSSSGKETCSSKKRKDSFSNSSSHANSMRRAASLFALCVSEESDQSHLKVDASPDHSWSRRQRQNAEKDASPRRLSEETEPLTTRARARVPKDYRHYLGMTDKTSVHTSLDPTLDHEGSRGKSGYEIDLGGPVRASTPVSSEERCSSKSSKMSHRPLWTNYSSSDTGQESSFSSTSRNSSNPVPHRKDTSATHQMTLLKKTAAISQNISSLNPVRKALRRAEARPKNLAKSMEDMTASLSPQQERRQDPNSDIRHISDASPISSPSSSLFTDPDHLKKMSKSVPMFLENEDVGDADSNLMNSYHRGRLMKGSSFTNLSSSSGMASVSSLSGSVMTMYSGDLEVQGNIQFSINYIQKLKEFHIFVAKCRDLAAADPKRGRSDPYVKSYLVPDKGNLGKRKTSVKKKTLSPTFNEILRYRVHMEYLRTQTLILSVWHHDTFGRNSFLGEVDVDLSKWDLEHTQMNYLALKAKNNPTLVSSSGRGEMRLAIRFLPLIVHGEGLVKEASHFYNGEIHIWVKECKNLPLIRTTIDPYVKCFVLPDTSRKSRQKTRVLRRTAHPVFNHTMVYDGIRDADLTEACVELSVWDRDRLASRQLGGLRLGVGTGQSYGATVNWMDSTPAEVAFWERMKATPNEWVEDILPLRMLNSAKTAFK